MTDLKKRRLLAGKTQTDVAREVGVLHNSISNWESGKNFPRPNEIPAYAKALECSTEQVMKDLLKMQRGGR